MMNSSQVVISDVLILGCILIVGLLFSRAILRKTNRLALISLCFGLGVGGITLSIFLLSWMGIPLNGLTLAILFVVLCVLFLTILGLQKKPIAGQTVETPIQSRKEIWITRSIWLIISLLILATVFLSIGLSYYTWDDISNWALKGYGIALEGTVFAGNRWGVNGLSYPLNMSLIISVFKIVDGDRLPGSKLVFPLFYLSLLAGCYFFLTRRGVKPWLASLGTLALASTPIMFQHATTGYANIPFTYYLTIGLTWCIEGIEKDGFRERLLGGILLAFAIWTRPEGVVLVTAALLGIGIALLLTRRKKVKVIQIMIPVVVMSAMWILFTKLYSTSYGTAYLYFNYAIRGIFAGQFHAEAFVTIFRFIAGQMVRYRDWGFLPILIGLGLIFSFQWKEVRSDLTKATMLFASLTMGSALLAMHYMSAFSPESADSLYTWLSLEFTRLIMPVVVCLTFLGLLSLQKRLHQVLDGIGQ